MNLTDLPLPVLGDATGTIFEETAKATHLPGSIYSSAAISALEKERIFMRQWLCVAREEEVAQPGDYLSLRIAGEPVLLSRAQDGTLHASLNVCLHRGAEVAHGKGNAKGFVCSYHAWGYGLDGRLTGAPRMADTGRDLGSYRLPSLRLALWRGWVFINFDQQAAPFEEFIAPLAEATPWYRTDQCRIARKLEFDVQCNWKCIAENLLDWYHASVVHAGTFGKFYKFGSGPLPARLLPSGASVITFDDASRKVDPNLPFPRLPWISGEGAFSGKGAIFPNINFWSGLDSLRMWHLWPDGPDKTHAVCYILLPEAAFSVPDFEAKLDQYADYVKQVALEDRAALESMQRGMSSAGYVPGPLSLMEEQLQHLLKHYVEVMGLRQAARS